MSNEIKCAWCGLTLDGDTYIIARGLHFCTEDHYNSWLNTDWRVAAKHRESQARRDELHRWESDGGMIHESEFDRDPGMEYRRHFHGDNDMDIIGRG